MYKQKNDLKCICMLFITALIWGVAFVSQSKGMEYMRPFTFTASRNILATLFLLPMVLKRLKAGGFSVSKTIKGGIICGLFLTTADFCQQYGITMTSVGKAGFITTLYIIFTPILGVFFRKSVSLKVWICAFISTIGMYLISITEGFTIGRGDLLVFICAILFAGHIIAIDKCNEDTDGIALSFVQFITCSVIGVIMSIIFDKPTVYQLKSGIMPILYAGVLSSGVGYTMQTAGQKGVNPTVAALILSLEAVVAAVAGVLAYRLGILSTDQSLSGRQILGCAIVFIAVIIVQLPKFDFKTRRFINE